MRTSVGAWFQRHQRAAGVGLIGSALVVLGAAGFLGWALVSGLSPTGQSGSSSQPSAGAAGTASVTEAPSASASAMVAPSASPSIVTGFAFSDILRVEVNDLAVRAAPTRDSPLMQGYRFEDAGFVALGEIRLDAGDYVSVHLGPLHIGDTVWYLVWPAHDARLHYSLVQWSTAAEYTGGTEPGWVAASVGEDHYLTFHKKPEPSEYVSFPPDGPQILLVSGNGDYESGPQFRYDLYAFNWAVAAGDAACAFEVVLLPEDGDVQPMVAADTTTADIAQGPIQGEDSLLGPEWGLGDTWDSFVVRVHTGCTWTIRLEPLPHD